MSIRNNINVQFDEETKQYYIHNDDTPGVYGLGEDMEVALEEYLSGIKDFILVSYKEKHGAKAFA